MQWMACDLQKLRKVFVVDEWVLSQQQTLELLFLFREEGRLLECLGFWVQNIGIGKSAGEVKFPNPVQYHL